MTADGFTGVSINSTYDAWTPARAYQHYHGGVRILTETVTSPSLGAPSAARRVLEATQRSAEIATAATATTALVALMI